MNDAIELVSDGTGLVILGEPGAVDRFVRAQGLETAPSRDLQTDALGATLGAAGRTVQAYAAIAAQSGRWLKMTEESARKVKDLGGLAATKTPGVSHAMLGKPGASKSWIQVASQPGSIAATLANPAALAAVGSLMAQQQMQESIDELKEYLAQIDEKVDDILRAQKDAVLADMVGVELVVEEAMTVRASVGRVSEVTWSKVQSGAGAVARTQAYALTQLDALAEKLESTSDMGALIAATRAAEAKVREWLAVIARSFQVQEALGVLELDRVSNSTPEELNTHRVGLQLARQNRLDLIGRSCGGLIERMNLASTRANQKVLFKPFESPKVVAMSNQVVTAVVEFEAHLQLTSTRDATPVRRWRTAAIETRDDVVESTLGTMNAARRMGAETAARASTLKAKAADVGTEELARASEARARLVGGVAKKVRRDRSEHESDD